MGPVDRRVIRVGLRERLTRALEIKLTLSINPDPTAGAMARLKGHQKIGAVCVELARNEWGSWRHLG